MDLTELGIALTALGAATTIYLSWKSTKLASEDYVEFELETLIRRLDSVLASDKLSLEDKAKALRLREGVEAILIADRADRALKRDVKRRTQIVAEMLGSEAAATAAAAKLSSQLARIDAEKPHE